MLLRLLSGQGALLDQGVADADGVHPVVGVLEGQVVCKRRHEAQAASAATAFKRQGDGVAENQVVCKREHKAHAASAATASKLEINGKRQVDRPLPSARNDTFLS